MTYDHHMEWIARRQIWEEISSAGIGVLVFLSPLILAGGVEVGGGVIICTGMAGMLIAMLGLVEWVQRERWQVLLELSAGAWILVSPFILQYGGNLRAWHLVLGVAVIAIALLKFWQSSYNRN